MKTFSGLTFAGILTLSAQGQEAQLSTEQNWHHESRPNYSYGVATDSALLFLENQTDREPQEIIIAIMDSGIDTTHNDLRGQLWENPGEIPGNGMDDDGNGYIDDVHGWNFIGGDSANIEGETMELTRLLVQFERNWEVMDKDSVRNNDPETYFFYKQLVRQHEQLVKENEFEQAFVNMLSTRMKNYEALVFEALESDYYTDEDLERLAEDGGQVGRAAESILSMQSEGLDAHFLQEYKDQVDGFLNYYLNKEWDVRTAIVGDDPNDWNDTIYGNNDIMGLSSDHGTHVAGIVGAIRNNDLGINGITPNVKIMVLRVVPNGDERDKDVALAIRYAVRNGASIINMSFGKDYSPDAERVREAIAWAGQKNVLLVHAAGNEGSDLDETDNFPSMPFDTSNYENETWVEVGASTINLGRLAADFSNYGEQSVDLFAPGEDIFSTVPMDDYRFESGTSMAAPVVTGVAGIIRSYYPELSAAQVKYVLVKSGSVPESDMSEYSISGTIVNAYNAIRFIEENADELMVNVESVDTEE